MVEYALLIASNRDLKNIFLSSLKVVFEGGGRLPIFLGHGCTPSKLIIPKSGANVLFSKECDPKPGQLCLPVNRVLPIIIVLTILAVLIGLSNMVISMDYWCEEHIIETCFGGHRFFC